MTILSNSYLPGSILDGSGCAHRCTTRGGRQVAPTYEPFIHNISPSNWRTEEGA